MPVMMAVLMPARRAKMMPVPSLTSNDLIDWPLGIMKKRPSDRVPSTSMMISFTFLASSFWSIISSPFSIGRAGAAARAGGP
ncbi:MAG: hypothetical protein MUF02_06710, partial [Acidobacteria bacterium]|nr:hypothetical protein [Acidobacteriota bacterium]